MVELRKRKDPPPAAVAPTKAADKKAKGGSASKPTARTAAGDSKAGDKAAADKATNSKAVSKAIGSDNAGNARATRGAGDVGDSGDSGDTGDSATASKPAAKRSGPPQVGEQIDFEGFGGTVETQDGEQTTIKQLVESSGAGIVIFTYPKASTPGCTTQACLFRDSFTPLTATGLDIYGLSRDSPRSNTTFKTKQNLPYALLCDKAATLIGAIGLKNGDKTQRGVFAVAKNGEVLAAEPGGPAATVEVVKAVVASMDKAATKL